MADALWTFEELLSASDGRARADIAPDLAIGSVSIDSRTLLPGALFVAIKGESLDGHDYVGKAFEAGAAAALVAAHAEVGEPGPLIRVRDTLEGLNRLGQTARGRTRAFVIAVTGSVGKTGTKEALRLALSVSGSVHVSEKSHNNQWGVPLSLANMARGTRFGVFEVGMNHPGEITPLTKLIRPHVAIITTVEPVHLEFFASVEEIAEAKAEIFSGLEKGGIAILNRDNPHFNLLKRRAEEAGAGRIIAFGAHEDADARLIELRDTGEGSEVWARIGGEALSYRIGAPGRHLAINSLAVLAAVEVAGGDVRAGADTLAGYRAQQGRGARETFMLPGGSVMVIDESYNANPASMRAAFATLGALPRDEFPRRIAVLGDMLELGTTSSDLHRDLAEPVDAAGVDVVFACGPHMQALFDALPAEHRGAWAEDSQGLEAPLLETVAAGDAVMIKGSLGSRMGPLVEALRKKLSG
jgi:UDP-N-acetylmuramoyl-tripeptide--D-alanyl-D-alanine ligase